MDLPIENGDSPVRYVTNYQRVPTNQLVIFTTYQLVRIMGWTMMNSAKFDECVNIKIDVGYPGYHGHLQCEVQITPITMVYGTYNYSYWGL